MSNSCPSLPSELWSRIFSHACTDRGSTGISLSLVCRVFNQLSDEFRFQSIAIDNRETLQRFCDALEHRSSAQRRVYHLLLDFPTPEPFSGPTWHPFPERRAPPPDHPAKRLMSMVAPTLKTLGFSTCAGAWFKLPGLCFPELRYLAMPSYHWGTLVNEREQQPIFPRLHTLRLAANWRASYMLHDVAVPAPNIKYLHIYGSEQDTYLPQALERLAGIYERPSTSTGAHAPTSSLEHLQSVFVETLPEIEDTAKADVDHPQMIEGVKRMVRQAEFHVPRVVFFPTTLSPQASLDELDRCWQEAASGGTGLKDLLLQSSDGHT